MNTHSDWISVKDRLPKGEPVWGYRPNASNKVESWVGYTAHNLTQVGVTHWMPATLPEPPKSEAATIALEAAWSAHVQSVIPTRAPSSLNPEWVGFKAGFLAGWQAHEKRGGG